MHFRDFVESGGNSPESLSSLLFIFQPRWHNAWHLSGMKWHLPNPKKAVMKNLVECLEALPGAFANLFEE